MDLSWIAGHATTAFYHDREPVGLKTKDGKDINFANFCESTTSPCRLNPLLFNGHLQTIYTAAKDQDIPIVYRRKVFESDDHHYPGSFAVDFVAETSGAHDSTLPPRTTLFTDQEFGDLGSHDTKPMIIALHGLSGGSHELYLRHVLAPLVSKTGGWEACVLNARGCAMSKITTGVLFNARATWDLRQLAKWLREKFPKRPLFAVGFSLGANILTTYLGEEGHSCVFSAAAVCSNPWNLEISHITLMNSMLGRAIYSKVMGGNMRKLFELHVDQIREHTKIDVEKVRGSRFLHEFDRYVQCPTWGYPTETAYYRDASSVDSLLAVRIPLFAINAEDDPIACREAIPYEEFKQNKYAVLCTTSQGGHLAWFQSGGKRWFAKAVSDFFIKAEKEIDFEASRAATAEIILASPEGGPQFDPMRRKMILPA